MKHYLIADAGGFLGTELIKQLAGKDNILITAATLQEVKLVVNQKNKIKMLFSMGDKTDSVAGLKLLYNVIPVRTLYVKGVPYNEKSISNRSDRIFGVGTDSPIIIDQEMGNFCHDGKYG